MSCRIDRLASVDSFPVFLISGQITGEHIETLRNVMQQEPGGFVIDLRNVLLVDQEAVRVLALCEARGTQLRNCPPYIREWVTREAAREELDNA